MVQNSALAVHVTVLADINLLFLDWYLLRLKR